MADETPRHEAASEGARLPPNLAALDRRLETDAALWLTHLPATTRLDEHARALPARLAAARPADASTHTQSTTTQNREPHMQTRIPAPPARLRSLLAATAALVVVGAIAALLISLGTRQHSPASGGPTPTANLAQPGPQARHIAAIYTATDIDAGYNPVHVTSTFQPGQTIYVTLQVRGLPKGEQHTVSVRWLLNGQPLEIPAEVMTQWPIKGDSNAYFGIKYPAAGQGTAKIYWDLPYSDASSPEDLLAWTVNFTVADIPPTPALSGTPTPMPTPPPPGGTPIPPTPTWSMPPTPTPTMSGPSATPTLPPPR